MIESGRFKAFVGFTSFPPKTSIVYKDNLKLEVSNSDLIHLRAVVNKAIKRCADLAPSEEEKAAAKGEREYLARVKAVTAVPVHILKRA